ncbi:MAG: hypothetical protein K6A31_10210 [Fibrobacter sp.]|nr:hypothetical protein [Fibrobacter sp.]
MKIAFLRVITPEAELIRSFTGVLRYLNRFSIAFDKQNGVRIYAFVFTDSVRAWVESLPHDFKYSFGFYREGTAEESLSHFPKKQKVA